MIGVLLSFQIEDERRESENAQRGGGEDSAFETGGRAIMQNFSGRSRGETQIIGQVVKKPLNSGRRFQRT